MRGTALPAVLFVVALGGALSVGASFVTRQLAAAARAEGTRIDTDAAAEEALSRAIVAVDSTWLGLSLGQTASLPQARVGEAVVQLWVTRADSSVYLVQASVTAQPKSLSYSRFELLVLYRGGNPAAVPGRSWISLQ